MAKIEVGQVFIWEGDRHKITHINDHDICNLRNMTYATEESRQVSIESLHNEFEKGNLRFLMPNELTKEKAEESRELHLEGITDLPEEQQKKVKFKFMVIEPIIPFLKMGEGLSKCIEERALELKRLGPKAIGGSPPVYQTIYRWIKTFRESGYDWRSLKPQNEKPHTTLMEPVVEEIMHKVFEQYENVPENFTIDTLAGEVSVELEKYNKENHTSYRVSQSTVRRRWIAKDPYYRDKHRHGDDVAYQNHGYKKRGIPTERPLERVEADHNIIDLIVVDKNGVEHTRRPTMTTIFDADTRSVLGFHVGMEPGSYVTILKALKHAIRRKSYVKTTYPQIKNDYPMHGMPDLLVCDNGKDFTSSHLEDTVHSIGFEIRFVKPATPRFKGKIERFFKTLNMGLIHQTPGTTFSNPTDKKKRDYNSQKHARVTLEDLIEKIHIWIIDVYHVKLHRGIKTTPLKLWKDKMDEKAIPLPRDVNWEKRIGKVNLNAGLSHDGIHYLYNRYASGELSQLRRNLLARDQKTKVKFIYDPDDLGKIRVLNPLTLKYLDVPCMDPAMNGVPEYKYRELLDTMNKEERASWQARANAMYEIKKVGPSTKPAKTKDESTDVANKPSTVANEVAATDQVTHLTLVKPKKYTEKDWEDAGRVKKYY